MLEKHKFKFAVIRYVPNFAREEFVNAGLILYDMTGHNILGRVMQNNRRMKSLDPNGDFKYFYKLVNQKLNYVGGLIDEQKKIRSNVHLGQALEKTFTGATVPSAGLISYSEVKSGIADDIEKKFEQLYEKFVAQKDIDYKEKPIFASNSD